MNPSALAAATAARTITPVSGWLAAGRLPMSITSAVSRADGPGQRWCSASTPAATARRIRASRESSAAWLTERRSRSIEAPLAMAFTEVPPSIRPTLKVVFGVLGTGICAMPAIARPRAWIGLGIPKSEKLWPPGPVIRTR